MVFLYSNDEKSKKGNKASPIKTASKRIKYLGSGGTGLGHGQLKDTAERNERRPK